MTKIFVQIAAYRDPQLLPTIADLLKRADHPEDLVIAIAWQHSKDDDWDNLDQYKNDPRFKIIDIDAKDSLGTCWARSLLNEQYGGEEYTLQLDSHHRFVRGWDTKCISMIKGLLAQGYKKPMLTAYAPSFNPHNDPADRVKDVWRLDFDRFTPEGVIFMLPAPIENIKGYDSPIPTRFFSAHFMFTHGEFIKEVPYDPNLYFHGEEISMAVRAYTHGYDMFTPNQIVCWHEYTRKGRVHHWDENSKWSELNKRSLRRVKGLLGVDGAVSEDMGKYGLGTVRDIFDYEQYSGIRFADRAVQQYTLNRLEPPNPLYRKTAFRESTFRHVFKHCIDIWEKSLPEEDYDFWAIIFVDENGEDMNRYDMNAQEIGEIKMLQTSEFYNIWREFDTTKRPHKWIVWPHSVSKGWCPQIEGILA